MKEINLAKVRAETKHCGDLIHFNNAGASLPPDCVVDAVIRHLQLEQKVGGYRAEEFAVEQISAFYDVFAQLLNCTPQEIAYVENATRAWDMAFYSVPFKSGDRILTAAAEYASNYLAFLQVSKRYNVQVDVVPNDADGQLSLEALQNMIDDRVKLIAITHVPTNGGLVNPAEEVGKIANAQGVLYLLDACQSVGQMPIDVEKIGCDMLAGTGRKFLRGPRGTGFLYIRQNLIESLEPPFIDLHSATWVTKDTYTLRNDAKRFENWESYVAGRIGLAEAARYALSIGLDAIEKRVKNLGKKLREELKTIPNVSVHDLGIDKCGIVTFTRSGEKATAIQQRLLSHDINVSVSTADYARIDMDSRGLDEIVRASVHYFNSEDEIQRFCEFLSK